ncbi:MAG: Fic family protein [Gammaproteobacteria bacterium]|nr:Fic family protein [Gammaproteobacteria bacterium]
MDNEITQPAYNIQSLRIGAGLSDVDNIKPSADFYSIAEESQSYKELEDKLAQHYEINAPSDLEKQCDIIAIRIAKLIESPSFSFRPTALANIHQQLFEGVFEGKISRYIGIYRKHNITKKESVIGGHSVQYADHSEIADALTYDFKEFDFDNLKALNQTALTKEIARFTSRIWQVHPFIEGNTRTITVFMIKLLNRLGIVADNSLFEKNAKYFRNALVLANFSYHKDNVHIIENRKYLDNFFIQLFNGSAKPLPKLENPFEQLTN